MISILTGKILSADATSVVLGVGGVGFKVHTTKAAAALLSLQTEPVTLRTHLAVREDALDLYGFLEENERQMFNLLLSVPGIGPRSALSVLDLGEVPALASAISKGDLGYLTAVSGIGRKTAEKIIVELREKAKALASKKSTDGDADVFEALKTLGYAPSDIRKALKELPESDDATPHRVREALKLLSQQK